MYGFEKSYEENLATCFFTGGRHHSQDLNVINTLNNPKSFHSDILQTSGMENEIKKRFFGPRKVDFRFKTNGSMKDNFFLDSYVISAKVRCANK